MELLPLTQKLGKYTCNNMMMNSVAEDTCTALLYALIVGFFCVLLPCVLLYYCVELKVPANLQLFRRGAGGRLRRSCLPPGPPALPLIGHLHLLGANPHRSLSELSKRYGPLMYLRLGSVPVVVASSSSAARLILQTHDQTFAWRPQNAVPMQVVGCKDVAFSQPGPYLKLIRQICVTDLFGSKRLEAFRPVIAEETRSLLRSIAIHSAANYEQQLVPLRAKLYEAVCNIISRMTLGKRLQEFDGLSNDPSKSLMALVLEFNKLLGVFNVGDFIPLLSWLDLQGYTRTSKAVGQKFRAVWQEIIDARRNARAAAAAGTHESEQADADFLDVLLSASGRKDVDIADFNIMAVLTDMFAAGIDTSTVITEWAFGELLREPLIMAKVQDELDKVVGPSRLVQASDIPRLPYLRAIVKETMRLHPSAPFLLPHMASGPCEIAGFDIPSNTQAYVNIWAIGRDKEIWDRPLDFYPERFLDSSIDVRGQHFELLPFGSGRRACPGMLLGLHNVHLILASLLHAFDWGATSGEVDMSEKYGLVMTLAKPLVVKAVLKVPRHLIEASSS